MSPKSTWASWRADTLIVIGRGLLAGADGGDAGRLAAGLLEHPGADGDDQAGLLEDRDELGGRHGAAVGGDPAQEGLGADDPARRQVDDRLVVEVELAGLEGVADLLLGGGRGERAGHGAVEHRDLARSLRLGLVHGHIGVAQDVLGLHAPVLGEGDAHAGGDADASRRRW